MALITVICIIYVFFYLEHISGDMEESISIYSKSISSIVEFIDRHNRRKFCNRIKSFVNYRLSEAREKMILAFKHRDRKALMEASRPFLETFRAESPYFASMAWILPDNTVFLRVHKPYLYGDNVGDMRQDIDTVNLTHRQVSGFAVGYLGIQFRVVQPVFYHNEYLGVVQFGIDARELLDIIRHEIGVAAGIAIRNDRYVFVTHPLMPAVSCNECTLQSLDIDLFRGLGSEICHSNAQVESTFQGRYYVIRNILGLPDFRGKNIGAVVVAMDVTRFHKSVKKAVLWSILFAATVLVISFFIMNASFEKILRRIVALNRSLSEEKEKLSQRVKERTAELEKKAAEYKLVAHAVENSIDAFVFADLSGRVTYPNRATCTLFGYTPEELIGRHVDIFFAEQGISGRSIYIALKRDGRWSANVVCVKRSGQEFECMLSCSMIRDAAGMPVGMLGILRDLSELRKMEEEKAVMEAQLHQAMKMESIGRLAGGVAHDFNNILNVINGYSELCLMETEPDHPIHEKIISILKAGRRAAQLTQQLLAFSRRQIISMEPVDIPRLLNDLNMMLSRILGEDIELRLNTNSHLWPVLSDRSQLEQVVMNLAVNARDAMPDGGTFTIETANVTINDRKARQCDIEPGDYVMITFSDSGHGIPAEIRDKIFEPFFTTKEQGKGTGLGLATVYGIIKQNNGTVEVSSSPDRGTTFRILLPRTTEDMEPPSVMSEDLDALCGGTETILLAEDDAEVSELTTGVLSELGYSVIAATNGIEALELFEQYHGRIDLLVTDVVMPKMKGTELARRIMEREPSIRVIYISGYTDDSRLGDDVEGKNIALLRKPVSIHRLAEMIRDVLDRDISAST